MARIKNSPESVQAKYSLAERLRQLRIEFFGERGGPELARQLNIPVRTWYNYEAGITVPAEVVLRIVELTGVDPLWLLNGRGEHVKSTETSCAGPTPSAQSLLREALKKLETPLNGTYPRYADKSMLPIKPIGQDRITPDGERSTQSLSDTHSADHEGRNSAVPHRNWLDREASRCVRVSGDDMDPILRDGAYVAFSETIVAPILLDGKLVVAWIEARPIVRWFQNAGTHAVLVAQNLTIAPNSILIPLDPIAQSHKVRRVLWVTTPH